MITEFVELKKQIARLEEERMQLRDKHFCILYLTTETRKESRQKGWQVTNKIESINLKTAVAPHQAKGTTCRALTPAIWGIYSHYP